MVRLIRHSYHDRTEPGYSGRPLVASMNSLINGRKEQNQAKIEKIKEGLVQVYVRNIVHDLITREEEKEAGNLVALAETNALIEKRYCQLKDLGLDVRQITNLTLEEAERTKDLYEKRRTELGILMRGNLKYIERVLQGASDVQTF